MKKTGLMDFPAQRRETACRMPYSKVKSNGMIAINAHYDGKVIVPDEPVDLPPNQALIVRIETKSLDKPPTRESALAWLAANASDSPDVPSDLSHQHDHYLYGVRKRDV